MTRYVAFLRAINVGGRNVKMEALRAAFAALDLKNVETFIASGNVLFDGSGRNESTLERKIAAHLESEFGFAVETFLRSADELQALVALHAREIPVSSAPTLNVGFLHAPMEKDAIAQLMALRTDIDDFHVAGREVWWLCQRKQNESKFSNALFERKLKLKTTFRGFETVRKLAVKCVS